MKKAVLFLAVVALVLLGAQCEEQSSTPPLSPEPASPAPLAPPEPKPAAEISNEFLVVTSPTPNQTIKSPVTVSGRSNFFEANTRIRIKDEKGKVLADTFTTAQGWMDKLYPFSANVTYDQPSAPNGVVEIFEESAKDGSDVNKVSIPVVFGD